MFDECRKPKLITGRFSLARTQVLTQLENQIPPEIKKWGPLKVWLQQNNIPAHMRNQLAAIRQKQYQLILQRRATMTQKPQHLQMPGQNDAKTDSLPNSDTHRLEPLELTTPHMAQNSPKPRTEGLNIISLLNDDPPKQPEIENGMRSPDWFPLFPAIQNSMTGQPRPEPTPLVRIRAEQESYSPYAT
ncbi:hypothetical protein FAUST_9141 [Fusarium austroamericanum]|uniref:Uncharacterized protein n=1 Tax=Fusarium austroamericanum TaxID=282268 RepID=A0AAN6BXB2_FUSAU|nr:hypothetical protein FAUST_9141 [Fusarium austroamericanum]